MLSASEARLIQNEYLQSAKLCRNDTFVLVSVSVTHTAYHVPTVFTSLRAVAMYIGAHHAWPW